MLALVIILTVGLLAVAGASYAAILHLLNEKNAERERYQKALELAQARARDQVAKVEAEAIRAVTAANEQTEDALLKGKQEGKRAVLAWIKQEVDAGTLEVRVVGTPVVPPAPAQPQQ